MNRGSTMRRSSDRRSQEIGDDRGTRSVKNRKNRAIGERSCICLFLDITSALLKIFLRWKFWQRKLQSRVKIFLNFLFKSFENWLTFRIKFISLQNFRIRFDKFLTTRSNESYFRIVKKKKKIQIQAEWNFLLVSRFRALLLCQGSSTRRLSSRAGNPFPPDPRTMAANVLVNVIRTVATEERVLFSRGRDGKLARTHSRFRLRYPRLTVN